MIFILENKRMKLLKRLLVNIAIYGWLLALFAYLGIGIRILLAGTPISEISWGGDVKWLDLWLVILCLWAVFWLLNSPVKKILTLVSIPVNVLTLGLFSLVINMLIFYLFAGVINSYFSPDISVQLGTLLQVFILSIIMSVCSSFLSKLL